MAQNDQMESARKRLVSTATIDGWPDTDSTFPLGAQLLNAWDCAASYFYPIACAVNVGYRLRQQPIGGSGITYDTMVMKKLK
ncbi:hypothetical protein CCR75_007250 [Bremia lactucae]|uniref:Uncharacterized protein n=1 Tax=Bremia lactucae TaxID=4779 RepID=A0A976P084_BRELC|nr:hypothetical protein CCR75_007250 [Bremia lactucae]